MPRFIMRVSDQGTEYLKCVTSNGDEFTPEEAAAWHLGEIANSLDEIRRNLGNIELGIEALPKG
jgi:hypothetical protein